VITIKPWHDCPACPSCAKPCGSLAWGRERYLEDVLACIACGHRWPGTEAERAQAEVADAAWAVERVR
jgi:Zn ribbon nucleic-acid-binding protein